jgi:hypothetical protein
MRTLLMPAGIQSRRITSRTSVMVARLCSSGSSQCDVPRGDGHRREDAEKAGQTIRQVLRVLTLQAVPSVTVVAPNTIPGDASDSRATIKKAMTDTSRARDRTTDPAVVALVPLTIRNLILI